MDRHRKVISFLMILFNGIGFLIYATADSPFATGVGTFVFLTFVPFYLVNTIAGFALLRNTKWSYRLCLIMALVNLIWVFPLSTPLGLYYVWFHYKFVAQGAWNEFFSILRI